MDWGQVFGTAAAFLSLLIVVGLGRSIWRRRHERAAGLFLCFLGLLGVGILYELGNRGLGLMAALFPTSSAALWQELVQRFWLINETVLFLATACWLHFFLVYPVRHPLLLRFPKFPLSFYIPLGLLAAARLVLQLLPGNPWVRFPALSKGLQGASLVASSMVVLAGFFLLFASYWRAQQPRTKRALRNLTIGLSVALLLLLAGYLVPLLVGRPIPMEPFFLLQSLGVLILLGVFGAAIVRYQWFHVGVVLSRGVAYAALTLSLLMLYVILAFLFVRLLGRPLHADNPLLVATFVLLITLLLHPLRLWGQEWVDRLFYRQQHDYRRVVREFGQDLSSLQELPVLMRLILNRVTDTWQLRGAALLLREEEDTSYRVRETQGLPTPCRDMFLPQESGVVQRLSQQPLPLDLQGEEEWVAGLPAREQEALRRLRGALLVPMRVKGELIGWLHLGGKRSSQPYTADDIELLGTLGDRAGVALENALLYERRRRELAALESLNRIALAATNIELEELLWQIRREVAQLVDAPNFYIALYNAELEVLSFVLFVEEGTRCPEQEQRAWSIGTSLVGEVIRTAEAIVTDDYVAECERRGTRPWRKLREGPRLAWMCVPLVAGTQVLGVLSVSSSREGAFYRPEHVRLLSTIAAQAAVVIEQRELREREQQRVAELETLNEIAQVIGSSIELEEVLQVIHQTVERILEVPNFYIALYHEEQARFSFALYIENGQPMPPPNDPWPLGEGLSSEIVRLRRPIVTTDYLGECQRRGVPAGGRPGKAWLGAPMIVGETVVGVMVASTFDETTVYTEEEARLLSTIAGQAAGAVQNARLYQESHRRLEELTSLFQMGTTIISTLDLQQVLDAVCREIVRLLDATSAYVCDWHDQRQETTVLAEHISPEAAPLEQISDLGVVYSEEDYIAALLRTGDPYTFYLSDPHLPEAERQYLQGFGGNSVLFLPLMARGRVIGYIEVWDSRSERRFSKNEILLGQNLASHAALAIENARLYERTDAALDRRVKELTAIEEIARELNTTLDFHRVIDVVLDRAMAATVGSTGLVAMLAPDEEGLYLLTYRGSPPEVAEYYQTHPWSLDRGIMSRVVRSNRPALVADVLQDPDYANVVSLTRSELAVPILYEGQAIGVINLESEQPAAFDEEHLRFLQQLADHATIAIRNARQYEEQVRHTGLLQQKTDQLTELLRVGNAMRAQLDLTQVLQIVVEAVCRSLGYTMALLSLVDPDDPRYLRRVACAGLSAEEFAPLRATPVPREQYSRVMQPEFRLGQAYFIDHRYTDFVALWGNDVPSHLPDLGERIEGEWHPDNLYLIPLISPEGNLLGILSVDDPVDRRLPTKETSDALELFANQAVIAIENARLFQQVTQVRDRLQAILNSTQDGILLLDEEGTIMLANPPIERWTGLSRTRLAGMRLLDLIRHTSREDRPVLKSLLGELRRARQTLEQSPFELLQGSFEVPVGPSNAFEWAQLPVLDEQGHRIGRILVVRDITKAREVERMREDLISMIVHDLRGPLTALLGSVETLLKGRAGSLGEVQRALLESAQEGGTHMLGLVNTLLDIRRLEVGKMPLYFRAVHIAEVTSVAVKQLESLANERRLAVQVEVPPDLPPVRADAEKVIRVLENLLHNAIKFSYPGGVIRIEARQENGLVLCTVLDHGTGISRSEQEWIFEKFGQLYRPGAPRGTGLGLAFCRLAVEAHGGHIWVESDEGKGSTFYFTIPTWEEEP